jgi:hypothetical protein
MNIPMGIHASVLMCAAVTLCACHDGVPSVEIGKAAMALTSQAAETRDAEVRLDAYFGDKFSEAQKSLASRPAEPDIPSF